MKLPSVALTVSCALCIVSAVCNVACSGSKPISGNYSGTFSWHDGLKDLTLSLDSDKQQRLDLRNGALEAEIRSLIQEKTRQANLNNARGIVAISFLGGSPSLVSLRRFEIRIPDFSELLSYVQLQDIDQIKRFVDANHDVNQRDLPSQRTALFYAASTSRQKSVRFLLSLHADPNIADFEGDTPLMAAVTIGSLGVVQDLMSSNANINQVNNNGETPVIRAATLGERDPLELLLKSGADPNYVTANGQSALRIAQANGDESIVALLRKYGASK